MMSSSLLTTMLKEKNKGFRIIDNGRNTNYIQNEERRYVLEGNLD